MSNRAVTAPLVIFLGFTAGCATNPATGERQLSLIPEQQEIQMGREAAQQVQQTLGFVDRPGLQAYVRQLGQQLAAASERPDLPWEFHVVDDPTPNAFALPGGFIYITRGMLNLLTSEAELASVLGHEIAHVTARHSVNQISKQQLAQLGFGLGSVFFPAVQELSPLIGSGLNLLFLKYGRDDEREADELGFEYMRASGYAPSEFADVFATLERAEPESAGAVPSWLSTHPAPAERVEAARTRAANVTAPADATVGRARYLRAIDGLIYGKNPRQGFFRDGVFYHPDLRFQVRFPADWQTQNLAQAVVGASPSGAAAIELTLTPAATPEQALRAFASQQGLQMAPPAERVLNGVPALVTEFVAETAQGRIRGVAAFPRHLGRTYQVLGYGATPYWGTFGPLVRNAIETFGPVTAPSILTVEPNRVDVVELNVPQTLAEFARRYPSAVPVEELAVINHVDEPATDRLSAGLLVKRVVS